MDDQDQRAYLIPANTKKSQLILGFFTPIDLAIFVVGCVVSLILLLLFSNKSNLSLLIMMLLPALISTFLVMPVPHYHNVLQLIKNIYRFFTNRRIFYWKGWSIYERFNSNDK